MILAPGRIKVRLPIVTRASPPIPRRPRRTTLSILLIRHAEAGDRREWAGDDRLRPLSEIGRDQAGRLATLWHEQPLKRILASPYTRCVQTVEPLAATLGLTVEETDALSEGGAADTLQLIHDLLGEDAALCTHGDVIPEVLQQLESEGVHILSEWKWRKASTWVIHTDDGAYSRATYVPRPL
jgi:8-oxo-dGTP diphosphatase